MPDKSIVEYIKKETAKGISRKRIEKALLSAGWPKKKINEAFYYLKGSENKMPEPVKGNLGILGKAKLMVSKPGSFFPHILNESIKPVLIFHSIFLFASYILLFLILVWASTTSVNAGQFFSSLGLLLLLIASSYIGIFFYALVVFLILKIFNRRTDYLSVFKITTYPLFFSIVVISTTTGLTAIITKFTSIADGVVIFFQVVNVAAALYSLYLQVVGLSENLKLEWWKSSIGVAAVLILQLAILVFLTQP